MWRCALCGWLNPSAARGCIDCDKGKPRKRERIDPSFRPWRAVVLALDAGTTSGWSIWVLGKLASSGEFPIYTDNGLREVVRVVEQAKSYASSLRVPWVALVEQAWGGRMGVGLGCAAGYWMFAIRNAQCPRSRIGSVLPNVWRARVLPKGSTKLSRVDVRVVEQAIASEVVQGRDVGEDEAPAILIGKWSTQAGEVGAMLPNVVDKPIGIFLLRKQLCSGAVCCSASASS